MTSRPSARLTPRRGQRTRSPARARYAYEYPVAGRRRTPAPVQAPIASGADRARSTPPRRWRMPGVLAVLWHGNAPRARLGDDPELALLADRARSPTAASSSAPWSPTRWRTPRGGRAAVRVDYDAERRTTCGCARTTPACTRRRRSTRRCPADTGTATSTPAWPPRRSRSTSTYTTPGAAQQPDGAARRDRRLGRRRRADALRLHPGRRPRTGTRSRRVLGLTPERVRVISPHVGGGFGSKGTPAAARRPGRDRGPGGRPAGQGRR